MKQNTENNVSNTIVVEKTTERKKVSIALQGGGSHGSFAWGVLDKLLEDGRLDIIGASGTSAGGMNAAALIQGLTQDGTVKARAVLKDYWNAIIKISNEKSILKRTPIDKALGYYNLDRSPGYIATEFLKSFMSPYDFNPQKANPLGDFLRGFFDFKSIRESDRKIFLGATEVESGCIKIFSNPDFTYETLLASACLPFLFHAVQVDGKYYWDGGFIANPAIFPLIDHCPCNDIIIIQLTRMKCSKLPKTKADISDRLKEITYNGCLVREMRSIHLLTKLIDMGIIKKGTMKRMNMHIIRNEDAFKGLNLSSALNSDEELIYMLFEEGRKAGARWLAEHYSDVCSNSRPKEAEQYMFADFL